MTDKFGLPRVPFWQLNWKFIIKQKIKKMRISKNRKAATLMGLRPKNKTQFLNPYELGFFCPICEKAIFFPLGEDWVFPDQLHFSEYNGFMYCSHCNIDIPSILCTDNSTIEKVKENTKMYLEIAEQIKGGFEYRLIGRD